MRHINKFEPKTFYIKYKIGDIVICTKFREELDIYKIVNVDAKYPYTLPYYIVDLSDDTFKVWVSDSDIKKATKKQIDDFNIKNDINKYNL